MVNQTEPGAIGEHLVARGCISQDVFDRAFAAARAAGGPVHRSLLELGFITEDVLYPALADHFGHPLHDRTENVPALCDQFSLNFEFLNSVEMLPMELNEDGELVVGNANPEIWDAIALMEFYTGRQVRPALISRSTLLQGLSLLKSGADSPDTGTGVHEQDSARLQALANEGPIIESVNRLFAEAMRRGASDVHIEAAETGGQIRLRVDGALQAYGDLSNIERSAYVSRLKIMSQLNISEKRRPQDGRAQVNVSGQFIDLRISTLPSQFGESVVIRLLEKKAKHLNWPSLGFDEERGRAIERIAAQPNGLFLVAGPTGSGKTTTLYAALSSLDAKHTKIVTVEDPVEFSLPGIVQVQVDQSVDLTFANALRSILRQDPDVVLIGEIRDEETAQIAVRAALVGRMVLSTIHTNDSLLAVDRLLNLGVPNYLVAATLRGVLSQRLLRATCENCKGEGCQSCGNTGVRGRVLVSELMQVKGSDQASLAQIKSTSEISETDALVNFETMSERATKLLQSGAVSEAEYVRSFGV